jgi:hypothetical protein
MARLGFTVRVRCSPRARRRWSDGGDRWWCVGEARRRRRRGERDRSLALTRRHHSHVLRRDRWWHRLPVDLGHKKYSIRCRGDLGSQWKREERAVVVKSDGNLPLLPRLRWFSDELARAWQGERERGMQWGGLSEERGCGEGANGKQRGRGEGCQGYICSRWSRFRVGSLEMIRRFGRIVGDGVMD